MTSSRSEIEDAILDAISKDAALRTKLEAVPDAVAHTVQELVPVDTGEAKLSIEAKARRSSWKKLTTRAIKIGEVYSDDDPEKINTLEYGRGDSDEHGGTPAFAMFRRAAARWLDAEIRL